MLSQMSSDQPYRRWQTDGGDNESKACGKGGHAASPEEEEASLFPLTQGTRGHPKPWRRHKRWVKRTL